MKVIICVDYSTSTENILSAAQQFLGTRLPQPEITVVHIIDTALLSNAIGNEADIMDELKKESKEVEKIARQQLGNQIQYIEHYGIPQVKIDELLSSTTFDLLVIGTRGRSLLTSMLLGSTAQHLLRTTKVPVLLIPNT